ncbi:MAG: Crp/Fnr family transcriptional regulator [Rikenellaceae bacterium]
MIKHSLSSCQLFEGMNPDEIGSVVELINYELITYSTGDVVVLEGNRLSSLMVLLSGTLSAEASDNNKGAQQIEKVEAPSIIAPGFLFAKEIVMPTTIVADSTSELLVISKEQFASLMQQNTKVLYNFMSIISAQNSFISDHVVYLTYKTIISKLSNYLLNLMQEQKSSTVTNPKTQVQMAEMFGVTRPALARTIGELVREGAIYVKGKQIKILFSEKLIQYAKK